MRNSRRERIIILGAGLAGLSAAYHLRQDYDIFERESQVGGLAGSFIVDGFTFDHAVHILYTQDPYASALMQDLLDDNLTRQERSSWVYSYNTYTRYPYQANTYGLPADIIRKNIVGLITAIYSRASRPVHNFHEWIYARFGCGIAENFMVPFNRKVWAVDLREMATSWIEERVPQPSLEEVLTGAFSDQTKSFGPNAEFWYPREGGIGALPRSFLPHVRKPRLNMDAVRIDPQKHEVQFRDGSSVHYSSLITSLPLSVLIGLTDRVPASLRLAGQQLKANRVVCVNLGIARPGISDRHWIYFPEDKYVFQRVSLPMNFSRSMAPPDTSSITAEVSEPPERHSAREGVVRDTVAGLIDAGLLRSDDTIVAQKVIEIGPAYIIYDHLHREVVDALHDYLHTLRIFPCGRFGEWEYLNMDQAVLSGKRAAEAAAR